MPKDKASRAYVLVISKVSPVTLTSAGVFNRRWWWRREGGKRGRIGRGRVPVSFNLLSGVIRSLGGHIQARVGRLIGGVQILRLLLIVSGHLLRVFLRQCRGDTKLRAEVKVWKLFVGNLLLDSHAFFNTFNFSANVTAVGGGNFFVAGNVLDLGLCAGLAGVHGGIARGGAGASELARARF